jgi:S1-C subfamily serine protease
LFDEEGRLIGIPTFKRRDAENLNFAVAIDEALSIMPSGIIATR